MHESAQRYYEVIRWGAEFLMLPLHYLALNHYHAAASVIGGVVLMFYVSLSVRHEQLKRRANAGNIRCM